MSRVRFLLDICTKVNQCSYNLTNHKSGPQVSDQWEHELELSRARPGDMSQFKLMHQNDIRDHHQSAKFLPIFEKF